MPNALAEVVALVRALNQQTLGPGDAQAALDALDGIDSVLDRLDRSPRSGRIPRAQLAELAASVNADDHIRAGLRDRGIELEDVADGVRWKRG